MLVGTESASKQDPNPCNHTIKTLPAPAVPLELLTEQNGAPELKCRQIEQQTLPTTGQHDVRGLSLYDNWLQLLATNS